MHKHLIVLLSHIYYTSHAILVKLFKMLKIILSLPKLVSRGNHTFRVLLLIGYKLIIVTQSICYQIILYVYLVRHLLLEKIGRISMAYSRHKDVFDAHSLNRGL
jgi:hypothetical protein